MLFQLSENETVLPFDLSFVPKSYTSIKYI